MKKSNSKKKAILILAVILTALMLASGCAPSSPIDGAVTTKTAGDLSSGVTEAETTVAPPAALDICVMSYNIAGYFATDDAHKNAVVSMILKTKPDVAVINETTDAMMKEQTSLSDIYDYVFSSVEGKNVDYLVLYKKGAFRALSDEAYCLSATPDTYSKVSGSYHYRMMTAVKFEHTVSGKQFYMIATHLENNSSNPDVFQTRNNARKLQAKFMLRLINDKLDASLPVIIAGDLNSSDRTDDKFRKGGISDILASGMFENCSAVAKKTTTEFTHLSGISLDHIVVTKGVFSVLEYKVDKSETPPSDHHPAIAVIEFKQ